MKTPYFLLVLLCLTLSYSCKRKGCTDTRADNYDFEAKKSDGSCYINGCRDPEAANYNPEATQDDGTCTYGDQYHQYGHVVVNAAVLFEYTTHPGGYVKDVLLQGHPVTGHPTASCILGGFSLYGDQETGRQNDFAGRYLVTKWWWHPKQLSLSLLPGKYHHLGFDFGVARIPNSVPPNRHPAESKLSNAGLYEEQLKTYRALHISGSFFWEDDTGTRLMPYEYLLADPSYYFKTSRLLGDFEVQPNDTAHITIQLDLEKCLEGVDVMADPISIGKTPINDRIFANLKESITVVQN